MKMCIIQNFVHSFALSLSILSLHSPDNHLKQVQVQAQCLHFHAILRSSSISRLTLARVLSVYLFI